MARVYFRIMDNKAWLWKKKSSLKNIERRHIATGLVMVYNVFVQKERVLDLERSLEELKKKLSSVCIESNSKDDLLAKQAKVSDEAIAGLAFTLTSHKYQQLDDALLQKRTGEQRVKECLQLLQVAKEDQQFIVNNAALKISREQEKIRSLEQRLVDTNQKLTESVVQNGNMKRIIEAKEHMLEELSESKSNQEAKLDSSDKFIASLRYELCMLQKEIEIRNEEREYNHRSATAAHRQHLENIKKIAKLETECQRLRIMVRKRLPGPTALAKMRIEVEALETRKKRSSSMNEDFHMKDMILDDCYDLSSKGVVSLVDQLRTTQDENKILKESLTKKNNELQGSQIMFAQTASKLSQVEKQFEELSKREACSELASGSSPVPYDLPLSSISEHDAGDDTVSCNESWASALISELEHFKSGKATTSEYSLMDGSIEMEKPATVSGDNNSCVTTRSSRAGLDLSEATGREIVPIRELTSKSRIRWSQFENQPCWLHDILRVILEKHHISQKSFSAILKDVRVALCELNYTSEGTYFDSKSSTQLSPSDFEESVRKLIELVEGIRNGLDVPSGDGEADSVEQNSPANVYLEEMLKTSNAKNERLMVQLQELEANVSDLQLQLAAAKESNGHIEDEIINQKLISEDLGTQLSVVKAELKEAHGKFLSLEVELEEKNNCCEELEATCLDLQLQIESALPKETPKLVLQQEEKRIEADCDIAAASAKLAACQETIINLGKQLKVLASPRDAPLFDKVISSPATVKSKRRLQLIDHMRAAEDQTEPESPNTKEIICTEVPKAATAYGSTRSMMNLSPEKSEKGVLTVAPKKQKGRGGFLRKLLLQRRKSKV
ncbi:hypothetical protein ZIOFF_061104 [Zingiber officinale]|uniref:Filament-like plant protein 7 n=1 Tax=Zingiber officinale TaxID=94328 RepID=A0A8J5F782_ZINOF|nr:hypothetical protein ZIOFF_061104 [Zingiber officinale]